MTHITLNSREELHDRLVSLVSKKLTKKQADLLTPFIYQYYATVSIEDLLEHDMNDLYGALLSHWHLGSVRAPGEVKLRIYNPHYEQDGWQSVHTIIEIVQEDMPFLVDSIQLELNRRGFTTHMVIHMGGLKVIRDNAHNIVEAFHAGEAKSPNSTEAYLFFEIDHQTDPAVLEDLERTLRKILNDVRLAVEDWRKILQKGSECLEELIKTPPPIEKSEMEEVIHFLKWIANDHFTFLGYRNYDLVKASDDIVLCGVPGTGLGVLRDKGESCGYRSFTHMTPEARELALSQYPLIIAKTNTKSTIHRPVYTDYIGVKRYNDKGEAIGEHRFIGLYTSAAYNRSPRDIPLLRRKVEEVMAKSCLSRNGHAGKALMNILETFPRDDLFQASVAELLEIGMGVLHIQERRRVKLFVRKDIYGRFMSCLLYVPRDQYNTQLRMDVQDVLVKAFHGSEVNFTTSFSESVLARIHYMIRIEPGDAPEFNLKSLEEKVIEIIRSWEDDFCEYLSDAVGEERANKLINLYLKGIPIGYREANNPRTAVFDIEHLEKLTGDNELQMNLYRLIDSSDNQFRFKLYHLNHPVPLSDVLPILENMGLRVIGESPYCILASDGTAAWIHDFILESQTSSSIEIDKLRPRFEEAFAKTWYKQNENDGFNKLVLLAGLTSREISILRAYARYFRQIGFTFSQNYIEEVLEKYSSIAHKLVELFNLRFTPGNRAENQAKIKTLESLLHDELEQVLSIDDDRILRQYLSCINATLRTNFFQKDKHGEFKEYISFKVDCEKVPDLPLPKPLYEIFVYSPRVEGVHLRTAKVARGGLRWSDRREDFRTEVLGLVKAQKVKNAVIVPSGAKGGFVPKNLPVGDRDAILAEGIACYQTFIRGLLDITDNLLNNQIVPPENVERYDDDDPYLVVAADKGTATFSNIANEISNEYNFWLGDAFASGGSAGYDHKQMGITAKGAWEAVKRRFREVDINPNQQDFTVIGIGDMSGDVFGNGMLLSHHIKLLGAFNHAHIFIDPNPDCMLSFKERERLFKLPRSAWSDYNPELISTGGGVYSRAAKSIKLSPEAVAVFNLPKDILTPNELVRALLKAKVDLLWNGGIGTYVKASYEINANVGDRTNDAVRITGNELQCKVVGEGGNLGMTQLSRVEYSLHGGRVYADFIDNSGGVDCSDHEVNLKILLNALIVSGDMTEKQRNKLLFEMTDEVGALVLRDNYWQAQAISIAMIQAKTNLDSFVRFIRELEEAGKLNREIEFLPDEKEMLERKARGITFTRPEICILLAYSKIILKEEILNSDVPEDPALSGIIDTAFPKKLLALYPEQVKKHSLRREIIATQWSNAIVNDMGIVFVKRLCDETGASAASIVRAYHAAREVFDLQTLFHEIEALDYKISVDTQVEMMIIVGKLIRRATRWFVNNHRDLSNLQAIIDEYKPCVDELSKHFPKYLMGTGKELFDKLLDRFYTLNVPKPVANKVAVALIMFSALDIVVISNEYKFDPSEVAKVYFNLGTSLDLGWLRGQIIMQLVDNHWESLAKSAFRDEIDSQQRELTIGVLKHGRIAHKLTSCIELWEKEHEGLIARWNNIVNELRASATNQFVMYIVAIRALQDLTQASIQAARGLHKGDDKSKGLPLKKNKLQEG